MLLEKAVQSHSLTSCYKLMMEVLFRWTIWNKHLKAHTEPEVIGATHSFVFVWFVFGDVYQPEGAPTQAKPSTPSSKSLSVKT